MTDLLQIAQHLGSRELFELFKQQLKKDFSECGCESDFFDALPQDFNEIKRLVAAEIKQNEKRSTFNLQQLLYRIDINEKRLSKELKLQAKEDYLMVISELIIKRILQKIVIKKYYSSNEDQKRLKE